MLIIAADAAGLFYAFGLSEKHFYPDRFSTFTVIAALNVLVYYLFAFHSLRRHKTTVFVPGWRYSAFTDMTMISGYGLLYMRTAYRQAEKSIHTALILLWIVLPLLLLIEWLVNEKKHTHYRFILIAMFLPVLYISAALIAGSTGHGFGISGNGWPYPFLNVDQLGWKLVIENCIVRILIWMIYCWLLVRTDRYCGRRKR